MARYIAPDFKTAAEAGLLILAVDDDETNRSLLARQLARLGFAAEFAEDGKQAWDLLQANPNHYGLLLTDCQMPQMDGYQLAVQVRANEGEWDTPLPIVALTAGTLDSNGKKCFDAGMTDFLQKPASTKLLDAKLSEHLPAAAELRLPADLPQKQVQSDGDATQTSNIASRGKGVLDLSILESIVGDDWPTILATLKRFQITNHNDLKELEAAMAADEVEQVGKIAHGIKGATRAIGAAKLGDYAEQIEKAGAGHDWETIHATMPKFQVEMSRVCDFITGLGEDNA